MGDPSMGVFAGDITTVDPGLLGVGSRNSIDAAYKPVSWVMLMCWGSIL